MSADNQAEDLVRMGDDVFAVGQPVMGRVTRTSDDVIVMRLAGNAWGLIHRTGLPVEYRGRSCREVVSVGAEIEAVVKGIDKQRHFILLNLVNSSFR
jgi:ribosomal protein S1